MSNKRKLRPAKGDAHTRAAIKVSRRARQEFAIMRKASAAKAAAASAAEAEPVKVVDPNACKCGRAVPKLYQKQGYCCVGCARGDGHTPSCNKRQAA